MCSLRSACQTTATTAVVGSVGLVTSHYVSLSFVGSIIAIWPVFTHNLSQVKWVTATGQHTRNCRSRVPNWQEPGADPGFWKGGGGAWGGGGGGGGVINWQCAHRRCVRAVDQILYGA